MPMNALRGQCSLEHQQNHHSLGKGSLLWAPASRHLQLNPLTCIVATSITHRLPSPQASSSQPVHCGHATALKTSSPHPLSVLSKWWASGTLKQGLLIAALLLLPSLSILTPFFNNTCSTSLSPSHQTAGYLKIAGSS